ncbi:hypothetical protein [Pseudaminobacter soli (ex Li et al. 2025)]|uniref:Uncharacterized protein n=1 Tax=Pseudaminobacter soli (ex Li et al. 2025) TaxID=1295366 RepID=A0A2P7SCV1_9HYPH|nr:hypothetical protein [Mesorhizobium soli]PSJ60155.1 hypothetical protein C7I85_13285 [Mesorhizobium soli]
MSPKNGSRSFILQAIDPATDSAVAEVRVLISDIDRLRMVLGLEEGEDPNLSGRYILSQCEMVEVGALCRPSFVPDRMLTVIEPWHSIREVPYLVHTNFELPLMLEGRKPLAVFSDGYPAQWFDDRIAHFEPFIESGRFVRRIVDRPFDATAKSQTGLDGIRTVCFALPSERWRIDAYMLLKYVGERSGWNESLERFEGLLLGYEDWQNDWWLDRYRERHEESPPK